MGIACDQCHHRWVYRKEWSDNSTGIVFRIDIEDECRRGLPPREVGEGCEFFEFDPRPPWR